MPNPDGSPTQQELQRMLGGNAGGLMLPPISGVQGGAGGRPLIAPGNQDFAPTNYSGPVPNFGGFDPFSQNPDYTSFVNPDGTLKDNLQLNRPQDVAGLGGSYAAGDPTVGGRNLFDQESADIQGLRSLSQSVGPTRFAKSLLDQQRLEQLQGTEDIDMRSAGANLDLYSQLAQEGGLGGGARERIGRSSERDRLLEQQSLGRAGQTQRLGILSADEQNKLRLMESLPGMTGNLSSRVSGVRSDDMNRGMQADMFNTGVQERNVERGMGIDQINLGTTIGGIQDQNLFNQGVFDRRAGIYGDYHTAQGIRRA